MEAYAEERLKICKQCPLCTNDLFGPICDSKKYIDKDGNISYTEKKGYTRGCNCNLKMKVQILDNHCVCKKW